MIELNFPNAIREERDFYGRQKELSRIESTFLARSGRPVIIRGERRIGKTSLQTISVKRLTAQDHRFVPLFLPQAPVIRSLHDYAVEILQSVCGFLGCTLQETGMVDKSGRFHFSSYGEYVQAIAQLLQRASDRVFILCIDEFDAIIHHLNDPQKRDEADKILGLTDYMIEEKIGLPFIFFLTMTRLPLSMRDSVSSPGIAKSELVDLAPFSYGETEQMIHGILGGEASLLPAAVETLHHLSGGHPYISKLLLDCLLKQYGPAENMTGEMVLSVVPQALDDARARAALANIYRVHFSDYEQKLVLLLAHSGGRQTADGLQALGAGFVSAARQLTRRGYLYWDEREGCSWRIPFIGRWLSNWELYEEEMARLELSVILPLLEAEIKINPLNQHVYLKGHLLPVTPQEYEVLSFLGRHVDQIVKRDHLADALWPENQGATTDAAMDALIARLRRKLGDNARHARYIETVQGQGFILHRATFLTSKENN